MRRRLVESTTGAAARIRARATSRTVSPWNPQRETVAEPTSGIDQGVGTSRIAGLDLLRGIAIALMVLDHALVVVDADSILRLTVTRLALPTFCIITGYLWRPRWTWRYVHLIAAAFIADLAATIIGPGMATPGILWLILQGYLVLWALDYLDAPPLIAIALALLSWRWMPIGGLPDWWTGYHPMEVAAWMLLGRHLLDLRHVQRLPRHRPLEHIGRHPLAWYVGHLTAIAAATLLTTVPPADASVLAPGSLGSDVQPAILQTVGSRGAPRSGVRLPPHENASRISQQATTTTITHHLSGAGGPGARQGDPSSSTGQVPQNRPERRHADHRAAAPDHTHHCPQLARPKGRGSVHLGTRTATLKESGPRVHIARAADTDYRLGRQSRCHRAQAYLTRRV